MLTELGTMLNTSGKSGHSSHVSKTWGRIFSLSSLNMMLIEFSVENRYKIRKFPIIPGLLSFYQECMLNFVNAFSSHFGTNM